MVTAAVASAHGFVLRYKPRREGGEPARLEVRHAGRESVAFDSSFRLLVRPLPTTPEAERERQPIVTPLAVVVYAGRIDNREEIADRLGKAWLGRATDGEVLAEAYAAWGSEFPAKVLGEYSVALVDRLTGRLVAARDSLGIGRLFRYEEARAVWVASSLDLLLGALPARPPFDRQCLAEYFASGGLVASGRTVYAGIHELPAAHALTQGEGPALVQRYWQPDPERRMALRGEGEYDEAFRSLLFEATRAALRSNTRVWSDLSGGLDSSTVTAAAALLDQAGRGPEAGVGTFGTFFSRTTASDERGFQNEFLSLYPLEHQTLDADEYPSFSLDEPPSCHPSKAILYRPVWHAANALFSSHGIRAHLTGRGGDPVFCADGFPPLYLAELARGLKWRRWFREARQWAGQGQRSFGNLLWHCSRGKLTDGFAGSPQGQAPAPEWLAPGFREEVSSVRWETWRAGPRLYASPGRELHYRSITLNAAIARFIPVGDERHPLLYRPLVEFALALPWEHLLRPKWDRVIQRRALRGILPEKIRLRRSKATGTPLLLRGLRENWSRVQPLTRGRRLAELGLVDPPAFQAACERLRHGLMGNDLGYFAAALSLEIWLDANPARQPEEALEAHFSSPELSPRLQSAAAF
jgi:asparagine synthase (glutamine-hydrolysing)